MMLTMPPLRGDDIVKVVISKHLGYFKKAQFYEALYYGWPGRRPASLYGFLLTSHRNCAVDSGCSHNHARYGSHPEGKVKAEFNGVESAVFRRCQASRRIRKI